MSVFPFCARVQSNSSFLSVTTASAMLTSGGLDFCLGLLSTLLAHWKKTPPDEVLSTAGEVLSLLTMYTYLVLLTRYLVLLMLLQLYSLVCNGLLLG